MQVRDEEDSSAHAKGHSRQNSSKNSSNKRNGRESGLFSLGIIDNGSQDEGMNTANKWMASTTSSRRSSIQTYTTSRFVVDVLFAKTTQNGHPQIRHALFFRKALAKWQRDNDQLRHQLAVATGEDTSTNTYLFQREQPALEYLDNVIQKQLLPVLQKEAVDGTVHALERRDAFDPVLDRNVYARTDSNEPQDVDMCKACTALYNFTGPLFLALHRLPKGGDMYLPLVAVLEHVILTFISRVKQQVSRICNDKTALQLLMDSTASSMSTVTGSDGSQVKSRSQSFGHVMERRKAFAQLVLAYADGDLLDAVNDEKTGELAGVPSIPAPSSDTPRGSDLTKNIAGMEDLDFEGGVEREEANLSVELNFVRPYLEFAGMELAQIKTCLDEDLMKAACLAHSLLKLASLLDSRLKVRSRLGITSTKTLTNTRALREAIKTIKANGLKMAKFCRADILLQRYVSKFSSFILLRSCGTKSWDERGMCTHTLSFISFIFQYHSSLQSVQFFHNRGQRCRAHSFLDQRSWGIHDSSLGQFARGGGKCRDRLRLFHIGTIHSALHHSDGPCFGGRKGSRLQGASDNEWNRSPRSIRFCLIPRSERSNVV